MIGVLSVGPGGAATAEALVISLGDAKLYPGRAADAVEDAWKNCDRLVLCMATGIAVRLVAPLLTDKHSDPGVVTIDEARANVIALIGGHEGGANALASRVAEIFGANPVVTTASEATGYPALGELGRDLGFKLDPSSDVAGVTSAALAGAEITLVEQQRYPLSPFPSNFTRSSTPGEHSVLIDDRVAAEGPRQIVLRPRSLVVGVGCSRGASAAAILDLVDRTLEGEGLHPLSVAEVRSVDAKSDESGLLEAAARRGWELRFYPADELSDIEVPNPSAAPLQAVGTPSVAEAAASIGADLIVEKQRSVDVTVAIGRLRARGALSIVGTGPGDLDLVPPLARAHLRAAEVVVGFDAYVERVRPLLSPWVTARTSPIGDEVARAEEAVAEGSKGLRVALVSSGDAGVYAMASPALEIAGDEIDVTVVPGITAALAAASLLGSPLGHDHCAISLSDHLTPWDEIVRRVEAAAQADLVVTFYNPRSSLRDWQLDHARDLLLVHRKPGTIVGLVKDAYRPEQVVQFTTLEEMDTGLVDMTTVVVVGNEATRLQAGRMVTPRGYR